MSEETNQAQGLEAELNKGQSNSETAKETQKQPETDNGSCGCSGGTCNSNKEPCADKEGCACKELEVKAAEADSNDAESKIEAAAEEATVEYVDPVTEEYLIERENNITPQWSLFYELEPLRNKTVHISMGF